ncbi:hypothetical protein EBR78_08325 [bacterium]|nr:hypothetical protein [bacterium]
MRAIEKSALEGLAAKAVRLEEIEEDDPWAAAIAANDLETECLGETIDLEIAIEVETEIETSAEIETETVTIVSLAKIVILTMMIASIGETTINGHDHPPIP